MTRLIGKKVASFVMLPLVKFLVALLLVPLSLSCPHLPASSSRWMERLASHQQRLPLSHQHQFPHSHKQQEPHCSHPHLAISQGSHLTRLRTILMELAMTIENKKERFARETMGTSFSQWEQTNSHISYEAILPSQALIPKSNTRAELISAYDTFQRLAILVEVVKADSSLYGYATRGTRHLWQLVERGLVRVLEQISLQLSMSMVVPLPLTRRVVPEWLRCMAHSVQRDTRDLVVLRETWRAATFFHKQLNGN